jgi:hypothetical protein
MPEEEFVGTDRHAGNVHGFAAEHKSPLTGPLFMASARAPATG